jgi:tRNA threonylcarbamoyladenosine modification (KEOPS) complex  Pcc1 subunit
MTRGPPWVATIDIDRGTPMAAEHLVRTLAPEVQREVPRARSIVERKATTHVVITIRARDTGALRAGLNTYLGWLDLVEATEEVARSPPEP